MSPMRRPAAAQAAVTPKPAAAVVDWSTWAETEDKQPGVDPPNSQDLAGCFQDSCDEGSGNEGSGQQEGGRDSDDGNHESDAESEKEGEGDSQDEGKKGRSKVATVAAGVGPDGKPLSKENSDVPYTPVQRHVFNKLMKAEPRFKQEFDSCADRAGRRAFVNGIVSKECDESVPSAPLTAIYIHLNPHRKKGQPFGCSIWTRTNDRPVPLQF